MRDFAGSAGVLARNLECAGLDGALDLASVRTRSGSDGIKVVFEVSHDPVATARGSDTETIPQRLCRRTLR